MNNDILKHLPEFETLLKTKNFNELNSSEKSIVLKYLKIEEYGLMRKAILLTSESFLFEDKILYPDEEVKLFLLDRLRSKTKPVKQKLSFFPLLLSFKIPAYQAVLIIIVTVFLSGRMISTKDQSVSTNSRVDTVFVLKQVLSQPISEFKQYIKKDKIKRIPHVLAKAPPPGLFNPYKISYANLVTRSQIDKIGHPVESDSNLYRHLFIVQ